MDVAASSFDLGSPEATASSERSQLDTLLSSIRACRACAREFSHEPRPVIQVTSETRLLICGQAPGRRAHESGLPFDDPSGDRLREWLGLDRDTFYADSRIGVVPMAFCVPGTNPKGGDYPPPPRCSAFWRRSLLACLPRVELTLMVGSCAQQWALQHTSGRSMTATVAAWRDYGPAVIPLPHPSWRSTVWLRRNPWFENELVPHLHTRVAAMLGNAATPL
ncbi:uracil-DNA glycosylase family protein [Rhizobium favelukesii]|uniref:uracil-DNA glycosylase family protein n=1 Tax=Rhizobium favelukesii TaxID=348824 RepID=UPI002852EBF2|nr:uracil-DNA glycosylase family protein [Rhizobium favelukesii]